MNSKPRFSPEPYREYLRLLAHTGGIRRIRAKIAPSDIVQEALLHAHRAGETFEGRTEEEYRAWLRTILKNVLKQMLRRFHTRKRDAALEVSIHAEVDRSARGLEHLLRQSCSSPSQKVARQELIQEFLTRLSELPEDQQTAIRLKHLDGLTIDEVAEEMDRSAPSVAGLLRRGLKTLREQLGSSAG